MYEHMRRGRMSFRTGDTVYTTEQEQNIRNKEKEINFSEYLKKRENEVWEQEICRPRNRNSM